MNRVTLLCYLKTLKENGYKTVPAGLIEVDRLIELLELEIQVQAQEEIHTLQVLLAQIPPDPIVITDEMFRNVYEEPQDWPWTREDWLSELDNRRPE